ncbi:MAG: putative teichuronic acid biosynthesis glycosyltransferase TuaC [Ignavibacteria bacterium]|nr:putative teichuronic acid biosynthesis glycosyltransferase TuaC [Ignavibacteria bacterium]
MNVIIIPSWYPDKMHPLDGIFVKEQSEALSDFFPEHNFAVSHCSENYLSLSSPEKSLKTINEYFKLKPEYRRLKNNFTEYYQPVLTWTEKLAGEIGRITDVHETNLKKAQKDFGKIDLMHAHVSYPAGYSAMKLKEKYGIPYILTEHMGPFPFDRYIENGIISDKISLPLQNADLITAPSTFQSESIYNFGFSRPVVIPNMINENVFRLNEKKTDPDKIKFYTLASFVSQKGIVELMEGIKSASAITDNFEFTIAGSGELEIYIKDFISKNNLSNIIKLVLNPSRMEAISLFGKSDVFILASRLESFGIVYVEALACGMPVIATNCGGPSDFVNDDTGLMIEKDNPEKIAEAIVYMTNNFSRFSREKIRNYFLDNFSCKSVSKNIISLYYSLIKEKQKN